MDQLYDQLKDYSASDYYGFHMPGHKRQAQPGIDLPYGIDITEIDGFDDLHHASGVLKAAQELAAKVYGAEETRYLVNGSTVGILSAILGSTGKGDRILVARHCHKSVYHAVYMNELRPVYLYPAFDADMHLNMDISVSAVRTALMERSDIRAVVIVSPTFDGVISDIKGIADAVHEKGIPLIVDEAHGSHLGFHPYFGENALAKGADVVIHSVHKTMPSLTQTALLHVQGELADRKRIFRYLDMLQSSSPSYVLMASIDHCVRMLEKQGAGLFEPYVKRLTDLRKSLKQMKRLRLLETKDYDCSKLVISTNGTRLTGRELYQILLERYHLQTEMAAGTYVIAMTSLCDTEEGFEGLRKALFEIDAKLAEGEAVAGGKKSVRRENAEAQDREKSVGRESAEAQDREKSVGGEGVEAKGVGGNAHPVNEQVFTCAEALELADKDPGSEPVSWVDAVGRISAEYAYLYPPGSPLIVPGERVLLETAELLEQYQKAGFRIEGIGTAHSIQVLRRDDSRDPEV